MLLGLDGTDARDRTHSRYLMLHVAAATATIPLERLLRCAPHARIPLRWLASIPRTRCKRRYLRAARTTTHTRIPSELGCGGLRLCASERRISHGARDVHRSTEVGIAAGRCNYRWFVGSAHIHGRVGGEGSWRDWDRGDGFVVDLRLAQARNTRSITLLVQNTD